MRTTYYHYIDGSVGIGTTYHTLATGTVNEFGIGISSHIGIGTIPRTGADLAIHHDGSEDNRTGGREINANTNASGDKHGARILAYNRVKANKGYRRLRFAASEYQFETPVDGTSTGSVVPSLNITGFGSVGIGTTNPTQILHLSSNSNQASIRLSNVGTGGTDWYVQSSGNDASNGQGNFSIYNGAINDYALSITAEGNVGIGTTTPSVKLDVIGSATVEGDLFLREVPSHGICKINANGNINLYADGEVRFYESDNNKLMFLFDVNTTNDDARIELMGDEDTYFNHPGDNQLGFTVGGNEVIRLRDRQVVFQPMTTAQRNALSAQEGGVIYNSSTNKLQVYNGSAWVDLH